ncbi:putative motility protein [Clostridium butyricum]|uniref:YjfB family protein n=1 Tax=Clostridium TaxID=1485 RepID=UPI0003F72ECF|nr:MULTISPECIES: YjfB family protein [Clostridium]MBO1685808.1 putative motility protein [Clostridium butyricum]MDB2153563.1 YjfB family protein [Clostridium butyricum]MDU4586267.1 YjfB family protein [Clostridium sp.]
MDIAALSMGMSNASLASAVQISVMKLGMNSNEEMASQMNEMLKNVAIETGKGINLDAKV